jgi:hypothetical protein
MTSLTDIANKIINRKTLDELHPYVTNAVNAEVLAERERCIKILDGLYKHDRKSSGYDEGWNDALGTAENAIRSMK